MTLCPAQPDLIQTLKLIKAPQYYLLCHHWSIAFSNVAWTNRWWRPKGCCVFFTVLKLPNPTPSPSSVMSAPLPPFLVKGLWHSSSKAIPLVRFSMKGLGKRMLSFFCSWPLFHSWTWSETLCPLSVLLPSPLTWSWCSAWKLSVKETTLEFQKDLAVTGPRAAAVEWAWPCLPRVFKFPGSAVEALPACDCAII